MTPAIWSLLRGLQSCCSGCIPGLWASLSRPILGGALVIRNLQAPWHSWPDVALIADRCLIASLLCSLWILCLCRLV